MRYPPIAANAVAQIQLRAIIHLFVHMWVLLRVCLRAHVVCIFERDEREEREEGRGRGKEGRRDGGTEGRRDGGRDGGTEGGREECIVRHAACMTLRMHAHGGVGGSPRDVPRPRYPSSFMTPW